MTDKKDADDLIGEFARRASGGNERSVRRFKIFLFLMFCLCIAFSILNMV